MELRQLGNTELRVSSIGMGCVTFGREIDRVTSFVVLDRAIDRGITLFDTAEAYAKGASETVLGAWIADRQIRDQIVLATKVHLPLSKTRIIESVEDSLNRLQTDAIDLFQLHLWDPDTPLEETMEALDALVQSGKVRYVGCSNFSSEQLQASLQVSHESGFATMQSVQPPYNLVERQIESNLLPLCEEKEIGVISYSPLAAGFLTGKYGRGQQVPQGSRFDVIPEHQPLYFNEQGFAALDRLNAAAKATGHSQIQLALAWVLHQPGITSMLIGARNINQVDQAFEAEQLEFSPPLSELLSKTLGEQDHASRTDH